jgi:hypothetical protein
MGVLTGLGIAGGGFLLDKFLGGDDINAADPWEQANAQFKANPSTSNYFGTTRFLNDDMGTKSYKDDKYYVDQQMSPEMTALADKMMGMAGRGQQTFTSGGMGDNLSGYMDNVLGNRTPTTFDRGELGFGSGTGPANVPVPEPVYDEEGNLIASEVPADQFDLNAYQDMLNALGNGTYHTQLPGGGGVGGNTLIQKY